MSLPDKGQTLILARRDRANDEFRMPKAVWQTREVEKAWRINWENGAGVER
jgi:hypothetical protein